MTEVANTTNISRVDAFRAGIIKVGRRVLGHVKKAEVVKGVAGGVGVGLLVGGELVAGCAPTDATLNPPSTETAHQTPTTIVSPSAAMPSETAYQSQLVETPAPTSTPDVTKAPTPVITASPTEAPTAAPTPRPTATSTRRPSPTPEPSIGDAATSTPQASPTP